MVSAPCGLHGSQHLRGSVNRLKDSKRSLTVLLYYTGHMKLFGGQATYGPCPISMVVFGPGSVSEPLVNDWGYKL